MELDDLPRAAKPKPRDLSEMSVAALQDYIADLKGEIARAEAAIAAKQNHRGAAEAFFRPKA